MELLLAGDPEARDLVGLPRAPGGRTRSGRELGEVHREAGRPVLAPEPRLDALVAAVDDDAVARDVGRHEEREALDVVPVQMRQEDVEDLGHAGLPRGHRGEPELARARAEIAQHVLGAADVDLDARRVAAERVGRGEVELLARRTARWPRRSSKDCPAAWRSARTSFRRSPVVPSGAGSEPRVPQNRISMDQARSAGLSARRARLGARRRIGERVGHAREAREYQGELADLEDLAHERLEGGDEDRPALGPDLPGGEHEDAEADAGDVVDAVEIEDQGVAGDAPVEVGGRAPS